jgi:RNA polymerase sigma-70 factor (ECF subfamily)
LALLPSKILRKQRLPVKETWFLGRPRFPLGRATRRLQRIRSPPLKPSPTRTVDGDLSDAELVRRAKAGDMAAFESLVSRHERRIFTLARRITGNEHDAEDVTQQTFLSALENLNGFREEASVGTWLSRIATHGALKVIRKRKGLPTVSLEENSDNSNGNRSVPLPQFIADWRQTPEELAQRRETQRILEEALDRLDEKHRAVFVLRDVEGFSVKETAAALGLSEANVKVRLLRARLQLREMLTRAFGDPARRVERPEHHQH